MTHDHGVRSDRDSLTLLVCRGCCCGTASKHPDVDHDEQLATLRSAAAHRASARMRVVRCLGQCHESNVVVVKHRRPTGGSATWLGRVLAPEAVGAIAEWVMDRTNQGEVPPSLRRLVFEPTDAQEVPICLRASSSG
jgi:hypothetical protein